MSDKIYWIWLQQVLGIATSIRTDEIISYFRTAKNVYFASEQERIISGIFTPRQVSKLEQSDLKKAQGIFASCVRNGWQVITPDDENYPSMLFKLPNFPLVLYVNGDLDCLKNKISVAIVGTREPSRNSATVARALSSSVVRSGAVVVSGGALGIDAAAHWGALDENGKTVAVLGCGFNFNYPVANEAMRRQIAQSGALITEFPPETPAIARNFPIRNRIISGLSYGTVVIEAGERSGSLITANHALEQGRDVFAVPGDLLSSEFTGANRLIRDGAKPVFSAWDVLGGFSMTYPEKINSDNIEKTLTLKNYGDPPSRSKADDNPPRTEKGEVKFIRQAEPPLLSENAKKIYRAFERPEMQADELILKTGLGASEFSGAMTELELFDLVELQAGKNYKLK